MIGFLVGWLAGAASTAVVAGYVWRQNAEGRPPTRR